MPTENTAQDDTKRFDELRTRVAAIKEKEGKSYSQLQTESGIRKGTLSLFMSDKYEGRNDVVADNIETWLSSRETTQKLRIRTAVSPSYRETPTCTRLTEVLNFAQLMTDIVVVATEPGLGKSSAIKQYAANTPNVWPLMADPQMKSISALTRKIAKILNITGSFAMELPYEIETRVRGCNGLFVIDESQFLSVEQLNQLRVYNETLGVGIALFGNPTVHARIEGKARHAAYAQLYSRIGMRLHLKAPKDGDLIALVDAWEIEDKGAREVLFAIGRKPGALRNIDKAMKLATLAANGQGKPISEKFIRKAHEQLSSAMDV